MGDIFMGEKSSQLFVASTLSAIDNTLVDFKVMCTRTASRDQVHTKSTIGFVQKRCASECLCVGRVAAPRPPPDFLPKTMIHTGEGSVRIKLLKREAL